MLDNANKPRSVERTSKQVVPVPHAQDGEKLDLVCSPARLTRVKDLLQKNTHQQCVTYTQNIIVFNYAQF